MECSTPKGLSLVVIGLGVMGARFTIRTRQKAIRPIVNKDVHDVYAP